MQPDDLCGPVSCCIVLPNWLAGGLENQECYCICPTLLPCSRLPQHRHGRACCAAGHICKTAGAGIPAGLGVRAACDCAEAVAALCCCQCWLLQLEPGERHLSYCLCQSKARGGGLDSQHIWPVLLWESSPCQRVVSLSQSTPVTAELTFPCCVCGPLFSLYCRCCCTSCWWPGAPQALRRLSSGYNASMHSRRSQRRQQQSSTCQTWRNGSQ